MEKPIIAITMGDAAGIGPELILKALALPQIYEACRPIVVGDPGLMHQTAQALGVRIGIDAVTSLAQAHSSPSQIAIIAPEERWSGKIPWGELEPRLGKLAANCLEKAFQLAMTGEVQGVVSAPINKQGFHLAGYDYLDDLAYLAEFTQSPEPYVLGIAGEMSLEETE